MRWRASAADGSWRPEGPLNVPITTKIAGARTDDGSENSLRKEWPASTQRASRPVPRSCSCAADWGATQPAPIR
jgi:hypothetical protein